VALQYVAAMPFPYKKIAGFSRPGWPSMVILWKLKKPVTGIAGGKDVTILDCPGIDLRSALGEPILACLVKPRTIQLVDCLIYQKERAIVSSK